MNEREGDIERWNMAFKHTFIFIDAIFVYNTHMYLNIYVLLFYTNESPCRTAFLRASKALRELGTRAFSLVWAAYFGVCICKRGDEGSTDMAVRFLFKSLGWWMSESKRKDHSRVSSPRLGSSSTSGVREKVCSWLEILKQGVRR